MVGRTIKRVEAGDDWFIKDDNNERSFNKALRGRRVTGTRRIGKLLLLDTDGPVLGLRFGMTGVLVVDGIEGVEELIYSSRRKDPKWDPTLLRSVVAAVEAAAPDAEWVWTNQVSAPVSLPGRSSAWATLYTKKPDGVYLTLEGIDGYTQGSVSEFGFDRQVEADPRGTRITIAFNERRQADDADFRKFLAEHAKKAGEK